MNALKNLPTCTLVFVLWTVKKNINLRSCGKDGVWSFDAALETCLSLKMNLPMRRGRLSCKNEI
jgi:hypothetical protein